MHEIFLIKDLMRKLASIASMLHTQKILGVKIRVAAAAHISPELFREHFARVTRGSSVEGAWLEIEVLTDTNDRLPQVIILDKVELED